MANSRLARLITDTIGTGWIKHPSDLINLLPYKDDRFFQEEFAQIKLANKERLAKYIKENTGWVVDPHSIFDVHIKRIHAYKRQLMNALHILHLYNRLLEDPHLQMNPRTLFCR